MDQTRILFPMLALAGWAMLVLALAGYRRLRAVSAGQLQPQDFALGESSAVSPVVALPNRNFMNLMEVPVLFYVVCLTCFVTQQVTALGVALAWTFVALRLIHSLVHLGSNNVVHRLVSFGSANFVLAFLWAHLLVRLMR